MKRIKYIGMLLLSLLTLGMTLYVLLSVETPESVTKAQEFSAETDSLKAAWVMVKDSLIQNNH